ncbi:hypothetical protein GcM1_170006 [Golovinomyces cichoracearum]|uniref:Uncharacterized protein n=1 Tax=Golovinomyces cichoracearum TaxID=62708 RepID=A0A420J6X7_9PEZI|nr:hypothetical protein GcM1_170006 [Golovinomyces cichoracearum]
MDYRDESITDVPVLAQDTHERWFRKMKIRLRAKGVDYVIEQSLRKYAALRGPDETRKLGAAGPDMKNAYTGQALLLVLTRSLPQEFVSTIDEIDVQTSMTVEEKLQHLEAKELKMKSTSEAAHASLKSCNKRSMSYHRRNDSSSSNDHWIRRCPNLKSTREYVRRLGHKKKTHFEGAPNSEQHTDFEEIESSSEEVCALTKEQIKYVPPSVWPSDTARTSHMSDKLDIFCQITPINRWTIRVDGGVMYAKYKGVANLVCKDGSSAVFIVITK